MTSRPFPIRFLVLLASMASALASATATWAVPPSLPFKEPWPGNSVQGWNGGSTASNPGLGGVEGDGFLLITQATSGKMGLKNQDDVYLGDWKAANITRVRFSLNDVNAADPLEIHFSIGTFQNFWQYNPGFIPPFHSWGAFTVDLTDETKFTQIIGTSPLSFDEALRNVAVIHFRHDMPPFFQSPDNVSGDVGVDDLILDNPSTPTLETTWGRIKQLYR